MKQFFEFVPIVVFVITYYLTDIYVATGALMAAVTLQIGALRVTGSEITQQVKITFWLVLVFGGLTLIYQDKAFIQWKPTILNWLLGATLIGSHFVGKRNVLERMLGTQMALPTAIWSHLNFGWAAGFILAGALNLYVAYNFSEAFWVNYKLIGGFGLTLLYVLATVGYLVATGHLKDEDPAAAKADESTVGDS